MFKIPCVIASLILLLPALSCGAEPGRVDTIIHAGTLLAVPGQRSQQRQSIHIAGERIIAVVSGYTDPQTLGAGVTLLDWSDKFVLPGLMDMHVHLTGELSPDSRTEALYVTTPMRALRGAHYAGKTLRAGFTTVRDVGAEPEAIYALRDAIARGFVEGPRIYAAGSAIAATGGHGDVDGYKSELLELWTPDTICDGPYDCRRAVRHAVKHGADWIKITATGGVLSDTKTGIGQQMADDELREIVATAHALGVKVAAHAHGTEGINAALRAGVDSIDHGSFLDADSVQLFESSGAYLVPTMLPAARIVEMMDGNPVFTDAIRAKAMLFVDRYFDVMERAFATDIRIAFGTDSGVTPHGENAHEFALMVRTGMSPAAAIRAATVAAAELLGAGEELGTIEPGKYADIIAVDGDPLRDVAVLTAVDAVMKNGELVD